MSTTEIVSGYPTPTWALTSHPSLQQVVFKALLTLHTLIRNGATDNILAYLSTGDVLRLRNVSAPNWEGVPFITIPIPGVKMTKPDDFCAGYRAPENLPKYATYLDTRIRAFRDLKHDAIRVQSENNRDLRNSAAIEGDTVKRKAPPPTDRRKTIVGRKLRIMTVEKGLLRETKVVQKMIDGLCECRVRVPFSPRAWFPHRVVVLSRQPGGRVEHHGVTDASQGPAHPFPSVQRGRHQRAW